MPPVLPHGDNNAGLEGKNKLKFIREIWPLAAHEVPINSESLDACLMIIIIRILPR